MLRHKFFLDFSVLHMNMNWKLKNCVFAYIDIFRDLYNSWLKRVRFDSIHSYKVWFVDWKYFAPENVNRRCMEFNVTFSKTVVDWSTDCRILTRNISRKQPSLLLWIGSIDHSSYIYILRSKQSGSISSEADVSCNWIRLLFNQVYSRDFDL